MPDVAIEESPEENCAELQTRAAAAHNRVQDVRSLPIREVAQPAVDEVLDRAGARPGGSLSLRDAVTPLRAERARR